MNYKRIYTEIIENRLKNPITEGYTENHHINPKSLGGLDNPDNLVKLSAREHFLCHYLLAKMYKYNSFNWYKMNHAFMMMKCESTTQSRYFNSRLYESLKENFSVVMRNSQKGKKNSQYGKMWVYNTDKEENRKIGKNEKNKYISNGWELGRVIKWTKRYCEVCNSLICYKSLSKFCSTECKKESLSLPNTNRNRKHTEKTKQYLSLLKKGTGMGKNNSQYGTIWINNGLKAIKIQKEEFSEYESLGWFKGRKILENTPP